MKVILVDNYARESVADILLEADLQPADAGRIANAYNTDPKRDPDRWATVVNDDHRLWRGMEDLV